MKLTILSVFILSSLFSKAQSIPNNSFENWSSVGSYSDPTEWTTPNSTSYVFPFYVLTVTESSESADGTKSARLETKDILDIPVPGLLTLGELNVNVFENTSSITGGVPFSYRPEKITGFYKYSPASNDSLLIAVFLLKFNNTTLQSDTIGIGAFSSPETINEFTDFEANIEYDNEEMPDSMNIIVMSSDVTNPVVGSVLHIDNLSFSYGVGTEQLFEENVFRVFPNPFQNEIFIETTGSKRTEVRIFDITGKLIFVKTLNPKTKIKKIITNNIPSGVYLLNVNNKTFKLIKN
jgi:hypothetical protein